MKPIRSVFFGTPAIAIPALRALHQTSELVAVVCQPDRPSGRGLAQSEPAVKIAARELGVEVHQPLRVKTELDQWLREREVDVAVVLAYGRILPESVLQAPRRGAMNLHASLLPKLRGAAPINWAIVRGETETGVSLMQMDVGLDTGPVFSRRSLPIALDENAGELATRMAELCAVMVRDDLPRAVSGELSAERQDEAQATHAPLITKENTRIDWNASATEVVNLIRGMAPRPGAHTQIKQKHLRITASRAAREPVEAPPGSVVLGIGRELLVATGAGGVEILRAQLEGKRELAASDLLNGRTLVAGDHLGT